MAFLSVLIRCVYIALLCLAVPWRKGNSPNVVRAVSSMDDPPTNLTAVAVSPTSIRITWGPSEYADTEVNITYAVTYTSPESFINEITIVISNRTILLENLEEGTLYYIMVETLCDGTHCGMAEVNVTTHSAVPSAPPANVTLMDIDPAMLKVTYSEVPEQHRNGDVLGYTIRYSRVDDTDAKPEDITIENNSILEVNITGLVAYANYSVEVAAFDNQKANGPFSVAMYSLSGQDTPSAPSSLTITDIGTRSITFSWLPPDTPNGVITHYVVQYRKPNETSYTISYMTDTSAMMHTIEGLMPAAMYTISLRAHTRVGAGPFINQTAVTATDLESLDPVTNITAPDDDISSSALTLNWMEADEQDGYNISYRVFYQPVSGPYGRIESVSRRKRQLSEEFTVDFTGPSGTLTNLNGSVTYKIQVAAVARAIYSDHEMIGNRSEAITVTTLVGVPTAPRGLNHSDVTQSSIFLMWQRPEPPNGLILMYTVTYNASIQYLNQETDAIETFSSSDAQNVSVVNESSSSINITDLRLGTKYLIYVVAHTSAGLGAASNISVSTLPDVPPKPRDPQVSQTTENTAVINIQQASDINGPIQYFAIIVVIGSDNSIDITNETDIGPYNETAADLARSIEEAYVYIASIVRTSDIDNYPHPYMLGDGSISHNRRMNYMNVPLQADTQYVIVVRAHTSDDLFADSDAVMVTTMAAETEDAEDDEMPLLAIVGAVVGGTLAFIITVIVIRIIVWCLHRRKKSSSKVPNGFDYSNTVVLQNMHSTDPGLMKSQISVTTLLEDYVGIEGKPFTFPSYLTSSYRSTPDLQWYLNGKDALESTSAKLCTNGQLTLPVVNREHEGEWCCEVNNTFGGSDIKFKSKLTVKCAEETQSQYSPMPVSKYGLHVNRLHANKNYLFDEQFESLYTGEGMSKVIGTKSANKSKNRFLNIVVYDGNRIALAPFGTYTDGYINASPIDGYESQKEYIATQGPTDATLNDFWRLIWQEHPSAIVMVTNLIEREKVKCVKYWPSTIGEYLTVGPFKVLMEEEQMFADYVIRKLQVVKLDSPKYAHTVIQYHFTAWPDHGVPDYATSILMLHSKILENHKSSDGPLLVHCSAGVGRTGTFITIDIALKQVQKEGVVDIYNIIQKLRHQRPYMVQTLDQYMFIHDAILESITCGNTQINVTNLQKMVNKLKQKDKVTSLSGFEQQLKVLEQVSPKLEDQLCSSGSKNSKRNRPGHDLPVEKFRVILKNETPDYINATYVKGYKQKNAFIVAQSPMENTIRDFWKMIYNLKCSTIVMLCELVENKQEVCAPYWCGGTTVDYDDVSITNISEVTYDEYTKRVFQVTDVKTNDSHQVTQLHYHGWEAYKTPSSSAGLLNMIEVIQRIQRRTTNKPIVVHCSNGIGRSGTFCVLYNVLEKIKVEKVADVFQTVKLLRIQKPGLVEDLDQYCFIFSAALQFLQSFETYSNFA